PLVDVVAEEVPVALRYNDAAFAVMMATPCDLEDFALGFSLSEGLIATPSQLLSIDIRPQLEGIELQMTVAEEAPGAGLDPANGRLLPGRGGCGLCLVGFARESGFNVYTHPERLQADDK
ncbi:formate dehydrogenase accessory sulfurtransferase FdhD, partial [Pantoea endophytica]